MKFFLLFFFYSLLTLIAWKCSEQPNPPIDHPPTTPDTTSHDFTWQSFTFGDGESYLQDVYAVNDSCVWAVGRIVLKDSTGQLDVANPYNAIYGNGKVWKLVRIYEKPWIPSPITCVFGIDTNSVWVGSSIPSMWDGRKWNHYGSQQGYPVRGWITKSWGNRDEMFFIGETGSITRWDGNTFQKMPTNTTIDLYDISGKYNGKIYACGGFNNGIVLEYNDGIWRAIDSLSDGGKVGRHTVYATDKFFAVGGMDVRYVDKAYADTIQKPPKKEIEGGLHNGYPIVTSSIRGSSRKNVFAVGDWQFIMHYNGKSWKWLKELWDDSGHSQYGIAVTENAAFIVGEEKRKATIFIGLRK